MKTTTRQSILHGMPSVAGALRCPLGYEVTVSVNGWLLTKQGGQSMQIREDEAHQVLSRIAEEAEEAQVLQAMAGRVVEAEAMDRKFARVAEDILYHPLRAFWPGNPRVGSPQWNGGRHA